MLSEDGTRTIQPLMGQSLNKLHTDYIDIVIARLNHRGPWSPKVSERMQVTVKFLAYLLLTE